MRTFHFPTMSISLWSILNRFNTDKSASYSRLSTGTGHFRITVWDPVLIIAQIVSIQCLYYFTMCVWITVISYVIGTSRSLDIIFEFKELSKVNSEKFVIAVFALNALSGATFIWRVVERYRLCLDFSCTIHTIHLAACMWYNNALPTPFWWLLNASCAAITCICAEFLCMRTELNTIPVNSGQTPKVDL
ncbi:protein SYS1 homolog [Melanaphis sacchari]|uniref:protein SYS1 homolog n=1 Tax=Melanaphis sacchari TaxID=742174 RepID=UPI000DC133F1|nr:protein SYS1 homolog [Melanaphis sacchari]XP_025200327.1 protein SYS1 homolog [Melanaphis sacchari]XP_025200328.1 protein SYS1 homolog [Melanaphis sacchari]